MMNSFGIDVMNSSRIEYASLVGNNNYASLVENNNKSSSSGANDALVGISAKILDITSHEQSFDTGKMVSFGSSIVKSGRSSIVSNMNSSKVSHTFDELIRVRSKHWR